MMRDTCRTVLGSTGESSAMTVLTGSYSLAINSYNITAASTDGSTSTAVQLTGTTVEAVATVGGTGSDDSGPGGFGEFDDGFSQSRRDALQQAAIEYFDTLATVRKLLASRDALRSDGPQGRDAAGELAASILAGEDLEAAPTVETVESGTSVTTTVVTAEVTTETRSGALFIGDDGDNRIAAPRFAAVLAGDGDDRVRAGRGHDLIGHEPSHH